VSPEGSDGMKEAPSLSPRLKALAKLIPPGQRVADIGTDHAALPIYLVETGLASYVVATEKAPGPYQVALNRVTATGLNRQIAVRLGDGLATIEQGEIDVLVLAGMGAKTIIEILEKEPAKAENANRILAQPMTGAEKLRAWLRKKGYVLFDEDIVREGRRLYEILVFSGAKRHGQWKNAAGLAGLDPASIGPAGDDPGSVYPAGVDPATVGRAGVDPLSLDMASVYPAGVDPAVLFLLGPFLIRRRHPLLPELLAEKIERWERAWRGLTRGSGDYSERADSAKMKELRELLTGARLVLAFLTRSTPSGQIGTTLANETSRRGGIGDDAR